MFINFFVFYWFSDVYYLNGDYNVIARVVSVDVLECLLRVYDLYIARI